MIGFYDIEVAKNLWKQKIQDARKDAFEKNDIALRDAILSNDFGAIAKATAKRDELRAIGEKISNAKTIEELKAILP